jgi:DNA repair exonuclease SbcCD nuclease subunit
MTQVKFLHAADLQLGMRRHFLSEESQPRFVQARIDAISSMADVASAHGCSFAVVCGDVWESNAIDRPTVGRALAAMGSLPCPVYLLPGNHDPLDAASIYRSDAFERYRPDNVHVIDAPDVVEVEPGVELVGVPWPSRIPRRDLVAEVLSGLGEAGDVIRICAAHGMVDELSPSPADPGLISRARMDEALAAGTVHFFALGDRHSSTNVAPRIWYSGAPEATDHDEVDSGNVLVVELGGGDDAVSVTPVRVGRWRFVRETFELTSTQDVEAMIDDLRSMPDRERTVLELTLVGHLGLAAKARLDAALDEYRGLFAALEIRERHTDLVVLPDELDMDELDLSGFARATVEELKEAARGDGEQALLARDALSLLYRIVMGVRS